MADIKYCKACLVTKVEMFVMEKTHYEFCYKLLTGIVVLKDDHICVQCASFLKKCDEFRLKCHHVNNLLEKYCGSEPVDVSDIIKSVDRDVSKLESNKKITTLPKACNINSSQETPDCDNFYIEIKSEPIASITCAETNNTNVKSMKNKQDITKDVEDLPESTSDALSDTECISQKEETCTDKNKKRFKRKKLGETKNDIGKKDSVNFLKHDNINKEGNEKTYLKTTRTKFNTDYFANYATVVLLTPEDAKKEVDLRKESSNYKNCPYKCDLCYRGFEAQATYNNHKKKHSSEFGILECEYCHFRFREQKVLLKHIYTCHKWKFYCKSCPYKCFSMDQAKSHISLHNGKTYPCKECGEVFSMPNSLLMHKRAKHVTECVCDLCGSTFATQRGLCSHKLLLHRQDTNEQQGPKCDVCDVNFATEVAWKRHLVLSSKHVVSNGCEYCGEIFTSETELKKHTKSHARNQLHRTSSVKFPLACDMCEKWIVNRTEYKEHMTLVHPESDAAKKIATEDNGQYVCEICGKTFKKQCFLEYHSRKHTGERPCKCDKCGKSYAFPGALSIHKVIHTSKKGHKCDICGKSFTFRSALSKHIKAHLGVRPHKCSVCDKTFPHPSDVKSHIKHVHYAVPWPKRDRTKRKAIDGYNITVEHE